ncbi:MAG: hypothetical protein ABEJ27_07165 [Halodesulfurarchaeum sp.]
MSRGQLVLVAGAVVAVALVAILGAALLLGYQPSETPPASPVPGTDIERAVGAAMYEAGPQIRELSWGNRERAVTRLEARLQSVLDDLQTAGVTQPRVQVIEYDTERARRLAQQACPEGGARQFGECAAVRGVVVQNRGNRTHLVAVTLRVTVQTEGSTATVHIVIQQAPRMIAEGLERPGPRRGVTVRQRRTAA